MPPRTQRHFRDMDYITFCRADLPVDKHGEPIEPGEL